MLLFVFYILAQKTVWFNPVQSSLRTFQPSQQTYLTSGYVYHNLYIINNGEPNCNSATAVFGEAVNQCFELNGNSYKYQITAGTQVLTKKMFISISYGSLIVHNQITARVP